ncbi:hypothetical protein BH10ACI2_BH10ACI2_26260 [soil metagenome]
MKFTTLFLIFTAGILSGCSTTANNTTNANMRGTNTNTGYVTNSDTNVKPTMPPNPTNITPGNLPSLSNSGNTNSYKTNNTNARSNTNPARNTNMAKNANH